MSYTNGHGAKVERVALYLRVSSEEQREKETIKTQSAFHENYVRLYGLDVAEVYSDDGVSGTVPLHERPAGKQLLADAKAGEFGTVLVYRLDRIGRTLLGVIDAHDRLQAAGVALKSATEPIDTASPAGRLIFQMLASFGEYERASIVERSRDGLHRALRDGKQPGRVPYGYDIADDGSFVVVEDEARVVRQIFANLASGSSLYTETKRLNEEGVPSPGQKYRGRPRKYGTWWGHSTLWGLVRQGAYSGTHTANTHDGPVERSVPAIVEPEMQRRAQERVAENKSALGGRPGRKYLLRGRIFCEKCGTSYVGDPGRSSTGKRLDHLGCTRNKRGYNPNRPKRCPRVNAEWLEGLVWADVRRFLENPGEVLERVRQSLEAESEGEETLPPGVRTLRAV
jgi:site-specific DNA recombinase